MSRSKAKLYFKTSAEGLKDGIECNSIPQVLLQFNYVERWGKNADIKEVIPEDTKNVNAFFSSVKKLSDTGFQAKKFKELWDECNMPDITDYEVMIE